MSQRRKGKGDGRALTIQEIMEDPNMSFMEKVRARMNTNSERSDRIKVVQVCMIDMCIHYENTPIQIYRKFHLQKQ